MATMPLEKMDFYFYGPQHPELVIAYIKAMIKVAQWANEHKRAAEAILNRQTFCLDAEDMVDKYLKIVEWDVPVSDEPRARKLIIGEIREVLARIEAQD